MNKVNEAEFVKVLQGLEHTKLSIELKGAITSRMTLNNTKVIIKNNTVTLLDKKAENYIIIDLNNTYRTLADENKHKVQANIDTLNEDIVTVIEEVVL